MRAGGVKRCPRCGELCVGRFNSLCLSCYARAEGAVAIGRALSSPSSGVVVRGG